MGGLNKDKKKRFYPAQILVVDIQYVDNFACLGPIYREHSVFAYNLMLEKFILSV